MKDDWKRVFAPEAVGSSVTCPDDAPLTGTNSSRLHGFATGASHHAARAALSLRGANRGSTTSVRVRFVSVSLLKSYPWPTNVLFN